MFSTDEQQELRKIEDGLRAQDRGFGRRLTLQQGVLCWAAPGRQGFLLALALAVVAAVALLAFGTVVTRRLLAAAGAALMPGLPALMVIGAKARAGWNAAQLRRHGAGWQRRGAPAVVSGCHGAAGYFTDRGIEEPEERATR